MYVHGLGATSPAYFTETAVHPLLAGHRSLLVDLLGHGHSDRPATFAYTLEDHADALAEALRAAEVTGAEVVAHSMGGSVAVVLAARHPELVSRLVLVDANLDPLTPRRGALGSRASRRTARRSSSRAAGGRCATGRASCGGRRCGWRAGRPCTAAPPIWSAARPPPCGSCCSACPSRAPSCTRRPTAPSPARRTWRRRASASSRSRTAATTSCWTTRRPSPARRPRHWPDLLPDPPEGPTCDCAVPCWTTSRASPPRSPTGVPYGTGWT
ncbi:alpha/beta fold hydrolase [Streptomyces sp. enrichment culture]|uniref:alpha/beta fold hydrolase n=1 Tax=Streptomyces sp. enrichment culture TaxID=1795815 RepID=UPI003F56E597